MAWRRKLGVAAQELGRQNELRVLDCCIRDLGYKARLSTEQEDGKGIDIVIETKEYGKVFLQVKTSSSRAKEFRKDPRYDKYLIEPVWAARDLKRLTSIIKNAVIRVKARIDEKRNKV